MECLYQYLSDSCLQIHCNFTYKANESPNVYCFIDDLSCFCQLNQTFFQTLSPRNIESLTFTIEQSKHALKFLKSLGTVSSDPTDMLYCFKNESRNSRRNIFRTVAFKIIILLVIHEFNNLKTIFILFTKILNNLKPYIY